MDKPKTFIRTYTGIYLDPYVIEPDEVDILDIAHSLSLMTRANGHIRHFFSVAQHAVNCALEAGNRGLSRRLRLACLLHDAAESYISDVTRPVKCRLTGYEQIEEYVLGVVFDKFGLGDLSGDELRAIKDIDDAMLYYEFEALAGVQIRDIAPVITMAHDFAYKPMADVERDFLSLFEALSK
jgi:5'-deoxynucleotidase YfbR-like HD superfamily hydrolase